MATVSKWTPFGVALDVTATGSSVTRTSATKFTVKINASWETYYSGAKTSYGMTASSGGSSVTLNPFGTAASNGSGLFTGTYSISGNGSATKTITVTFRNFNDDNGDSATKIVSFTVSVPAWTSYAIKYNANGGSGAPGNQTKWKDQTLTLSSTKPTRTGYSFLGWSTSSTATTASYSAGGSYTANSAATLYAVWKANTYTIKYNANGGSGAPSNQTKTYGKTLTLSSVKPTRTNYIFKGWSTSASATTATYSAGGTYTSNSSATLYAVWELAYTKPRISNISVDRCDSDGTITDEGMYALVKFDWGSDKNTSTATIEWRLTTENTYSNVETISLSSNSGTVSRIVGGSLDVESTYVVRIAVSDSVGSTFITRTLNGSMLIIDVLPENKGISFGKPAELQGFLDSAYTGLFRKPIYMGYYDDHEKAIHFANNAKRIGQTYAGNGVYPHWCAVYGGNGASMIAIGLYDISNNRPILAYNDVSNTITTGSVIRQPIVEAHPTTKHTITTTNTWEKITLGGTTFDASVFSNYLSLSDGSIVCAREGYVLCSAEVYLEYITSGDNIGAAIYKDSSAMTYSFASRAATNAYISIPPKMIHVTAGQKISLYCRNVTGARGNTSTIPATTRLTVQYIG